MAKYLVLSGNAFSFQDSEDTTRTITGATILALDIEETPENTPGRKGVQPFKLNIDQQVLQFMELPAVYDLDIRQTAGGAMKAKSIVRGAQLIAPFVPATLLPKQAKAS